MSAETDNDGLEKAVLRARAKASADWPKRMMRARGKLLANEFNIGLVLRNDPRFAGFTFNTRAVQILYKGEPFNDGAFGLLLERLQRAHFARLDPRPLKQAIVTVSRESGFDPVRAYLDGLKWDRTERLSTLAARALGATGKLEATLVRKWVISAMARAMKPGVKVDTVLVLVGAQGARKSSFFRELASEPFFCDSPFALGSKDACLTIRQGWIHELAEVDDITTRRTASELKSFITIAEDNFRPPYAGANERFPRAMVFAGSTNETGYLADATGSRRFWTVTVRGNVDLDVVRAERDQLWAEARAAYEGGEPWWLDSADDAARAEQAREHVVSDPWEEMVDRWLCARPAATPTAAQLLEEAVRLEPHQMGKAAEMRVATVMQSLGWCRVREGKGKRQWVYRRPASSFETGGGTREHAANSQTRLTVPPSGAVPAQRTVSLLDREPLLVGRGGTVGRSSGNAGQSASHLPSHLEPGKTQPKPVAPWSRAKAADDAA